MWEYGEDNVVIYLQKYQLFGQIGLDHGPEWFHAKITGLSTTFTAPKGKKVVTVSEE